MTNFPSGVYSTKRARVCEWGVCVQLLVEAIPKKSYCRKSFQKKNNRYTVTWRHKDTYTFSHVDLENETVRWTRRKQNIVFHMMYAPGAHKQLNKYSIYIWKCSNTKSKRRVVYRIYINIHGAARFAIVLYQERAYNLHRRYANGWSVIIVLEVHKARV